MLKLDLTGPTPQLYLYGLIARQAWYMDPGEVISADEVIELLGQVDAGRDLHVRINSEGGDVFEGVAIYNALLRRGRVTVYVDALAASIASVIAMAGDQIVMAGNSWLMVHRAWTMAAGNAEELAKVVETLRKIDSTITGTYVARAGAKTTREAIEAWLEAETWMDPDEAIARGFADRKEDLKGAPQASVAPGRFRNCPQSLLATDPAPQRPAAERIVQRPTEPPPRASSVPAISARLADLRARVGR
jgi:ATP-dependent Clp protease, protease subunit